VLPKAKGVHAIMGDAQLSPKGTSDRAALKSLINKIQARIPKINEVLLKENQSKNGFI